MLKSVTSCFNSFINSSFQPATKFPLSSEYLAIIPATKSQTDVNVANIKLIGQNTENTRLRNLGQETQNELLKLEKHYQEGTLDSRILNQTLVNDNLSANIRKLNEEIPWIGKLAQGQLNVYEADVKLKKSQVKVNEQNVKTGKAVS